MNVYIVAGAHNNVCINKSVDYIKTITNRLNKLFNVFHITGNSPDHDILFVRKFKYLATTGGGYGKILSHVVLGNNGIIYD